LKIVWNEYRCKQTTCCTECICIKCTQCTCKWSRHRKVIWCRLNVNETEKRNCSSLIDQINIYMNHQESECERLRNYLEQEKFAKRSHSESAVCH